MVATQNTCVVDVKPALGVHSHAQRMMHGTNLRLLNWLELDFDLTKCNIESTGRIRK